MDRSASGESALDAIRRSLGLIGAILCCLLRQGQRKCNPYSMSLFGKAFVMSNIFDILCHGHSKRVYRSGMADGVFLSIRTPSIYCLCSIVVP